LAGRAIEQFFIDLNGLYGRWIEWPPGLFTIKSLPQERPWEEEFPEFTLQSTPVAHTSSSLGFRITLPNGKGLVFSGDSDYSASLVELAQKADILICECSFPEEEKVTGHLTPSLAGRIAREAGVGRLYLTHFYPECRGKDLIGPCNREYRGPIFLAEDFQIVPI
jgi:ribonuclease BN (tRNA processing enzyme)